MSRRRRARVFRGQGVYRYGALHFLRPLRREVHQGQIYKGVSSRRIQTRDLVVRAGEGGYVPPVQTDAEALRLKGSLQLREVSAGGCAVCELDANVLGTPAWDMARFGIRFAASPRHADAVYLTGPISKNMQLALDKTYAAMPEPRFLIAAGACAISGGLYERGECPAEPALYIPGCPPHPATTLEALLRFVGDM